MDSFDPRIIKVGIEVNGNIKVYQDLDIRASGTKYANANQNECEVKITNLDNETLNYILTQTSPFNNNKTPKELVKKNYSELLAYLTVYTVNLFRKCRVNYLAHLHMIPVLLTYGLPLLILTYNTVILLY